MKLDQSKAYHWKAMNHGKAMKCFRSLSFPGKRGITPYNFEVDSNKFNQKKNTFLSGQRPF